MGVGGSDRGLMGLRERVWGEMTGIGGRLGCGVET